MSAPIESTVKRLFDGLEARGLRYAVLRNYEQLPSVQRGHAGPHTDIDLVVASGDLKELRHILATIAELDGWDALTECDHFAQSPIRHHNIEVFRLYRFYPLDYLQIDVFHGFLIWALPIFDERQLLSGRIYDEARSLTHIDTLKENVFRLFQIAAHCEETPRKAARYRDKVLAFRSAEPERFEQGFSRILSGYALDAVSALERSDMGAFLGKMRMVRFLFTTRFAIRHPLRTLLYILCRLNDTAQRFYLRQCGCKVRVYAPSGLERDALRGVMNELIETSLLDCWKEYEEPAPRSWQDHRMMEQNVVLIEWTRDSAAQIDVSGLSDPRLCAAEILNFLVARHRTLYLRPKRIESSLSEEVAR